MWLSAPSFVINSITIRIQPGVTIKESPLAKRKQKHRNSMHFQINFSLDSPVKMRLTSLTNFFVDFRGGAERTYWDPKDAWKANQMSWSWRWWWCWWLGGSSWWRWWCWWSSRPASPPPLSSWPGTFRLASPKRSRLSTHLYQQCWFITNLFTSKRSSGRNSPLRRSHNWQVFQHAWTTLTWKQETLADYM